MKLHLESSHFFAPPIRIKKGTVDEEGDACVFCPLSTLKTKNYLRLPYEQEWLPLSLWELFAMLRDAAEAPA